MHVQLPPSRVVVQPLAMEVRVVFQVGNSRNAFDSTHDILGLKLGKDVGNGGCFYTVNIIACVLDLDGVVVEPPRIVRIGELLCYFVCSVGVQEVVDEDMRKWTGRLKRLGELSEIVCPLGKHFGVSCLLSKKKQVNRQRTILLHSTKALKDKKNLAIPQALMEIKSDVIIFCLYFDDRTKAYIDAHYAHLIGDWLYPVEMPAQTKYLEHIFYTTWLMENKHLWEHKRYVGAVSWKFNQKIRIPDLSHYEGDEDFVGFFLQRESLIDHTNACIPRFMESYVPILQRMGYKLDDILSPDVPYFVFNYWMCKPDWMVRYVKYLSQIMQLMETWPYIQDDLYIDSTYPHPPHMTRERLIKTFDRPYYTHHCFILERTGPFFFWAEGASLKALQQSP